MRIAGLWLLPLTRRLRCTRALYRNERRPVRRYPTAPIVDIHAKLLLQLVDIPTIQSLSLPGDEQPMLSVARAPPATPKLIPRDQPLERRAPLIRTGIAGPLRVHWWPVGHRAPGRLMGLAVHQKKRR
jgi:hypothetical protein